MREELHKSGLSLADAMHACNIADNAALSIKTVEAVLLKAGIVLKAAEIPFLMRKVNG
jgi:hypothetical protein